MAIGISLRMLMVAGADSFTPTPGENYITDSDSDRLLDANADNIVEGGESFAPALSGGSETTLVSGTVDGHDWFGRAYIRRRSDDVLVMIYRSGTGHNTNDAELHIRFSDDDGATWTADDTTLGAAAVTGFPMNPPTGNISYGEGCPRIAPNGNIIVHMWSVTGTHPAGTLNGTYQATSTDGGETWNTPAAVTITDNPFTDTDTFITDDDFIVDGVMYAGARVYHDTDGDPSSSILVKSTDNGASWAYVSTIQGQAEGGTGGQEVGLEYLGSDTVIAMLRDNPHTNFYKRVSTDLGETWGTLTDVTSEVGIAGRQRVYTVAHLKGEASWWEDETLIMSGFIHTSSGSSVPRHNAVWVSEDSGATWVYFLLDSETQDAGYGDIFYDATNDEFVVVINHGTQAACSLKQYRFKLTGVE